MKEIPLVRLNRETQVDEVIGYSLVDEEDFNKLSQWVWRKQSSGYAYRSERYLNKTKTILMHRFICDNPVGMQVDHINHNITDNRRSNLRVCSKDQNNINRLKKLNTSSKYKGVSYDKERGKWQASITLNAKKHHIGRFDHEMDAAYYYNQKAIALFQDYSLLNDIGDYIPSVLLKQAHKHIKEAKSKYVGVFKQSPNSKYFMSIQYKGKVIRETGFSNEEDAAKRYDYWSKKIYGDKAKLNFPELAVTA